MPRLKKAKGEGRCTTYGEPVDLVCAYHYGLRYSAPRTHPANPVPHHAMHTPAQPGGTQGRQIHAREHQQGGSAVLQFCLPPVRLDLDLELPCTGREAGPGWRRHHSSPPRTPDGTADNTATTTAIAILSGACRPMIYFWHSQRRYRHDTAPPAVCSYASRCTQLTQRAHHAVPPRSSASCSRHSTAAQLRSHLFMTRVPITSLSKRMFVSSGERKGKCPYTHHRILCRSSHNTVGFG